MCFLSLPPSITVVSEKDNLFNNNNKNYKYDSTSLYTRAVRNVFPERYYICRTYIIMLRLNAVSPLHILPYTYNFVKSWVVKDRKLIISSTEKL